MAKATAAKAEVAANSVYTPEQLQNFLNDLAIGKDAPITYEEIFALLENVETGEFEDLNSDYWTPEENKFYNFIFEGMTTGNMKGKTLQQAKLRDISGHTFVASQTVLVGTLKNVQRIPCFVKIIVGKMKEGKEGDYFDMKIKVLPGTRVADIPAIGSAEHPFS